MSQLGHLHKRTKSDKDNKDAGSTGFFEPLHELPETTIAKAPNTMLSAARQDDEEEKVKRKASALSNYSKACSFQSTDPHIEEWKAKVYRALLEYACKKWRRSFNLERAPRLLQSLFPELPWSGPTLLELYELDPAHPDLKDVDECMKGFVQLVLKIGLDETDHPFPQQAVRMLMVNEKPDLELKVEHIDRKTYCEVVTLLQQKHYWTGISMLFPALRFSGNPKDERWWVEGKEDAVSEWSRAFVDRGVVIAVFNRMLRAPSVKDGEGKPYAKILPLIQAAGTRKSKLLKHLVDCVPGIYINLANSKYVLPARDDQVLRFLKDQDMTTTRFICLFDALLQKTFEKLELFYDLSRTQRRPAEAITPISTQEQLARAFQASLDSSGSDGREGRVHFPSLTQPRIRFMQDVVEEAEKTLEKLKADPVWDNERSILARSNWNKKLANFVLAEFIKPWKEKLAKLRDYKLTPCKAIEDLMKDKKLPDDAFPVKFIFCIDELTRMELSKEKNRGNKQEVFEQVRHHVERAASFFHSLDVWFIYASPFPHLSTIESSRWHTSDRVSSGEYELPKPFCTMPFHIGASERMSGDHQTRKLFDKKPLSTFSDPQHLTLYGRPMWAEFLKAREEDFNRVIFGRLMGHYHDKMTPLDDYESGWLFDKTNPSHIFSIISVRAFLDPIVGAHSSMDSFFSDNVLKHLCPLKDLNPKYGIIQLDQYMDPPLASAVTRFFTRDPANWPTLIQALSMLLVNYPIRDLKGERGELFCRLICLIARDHAWVNHLKVLKQDQAPASSPFPLHQFLNALLPDTVQGWKLQRERAIGRIADANGNLSKKRKPIKDILDNAYVNFTHFCLCEKPLDKDTIPFVLQNLLRQGAALICKPGQSAWDLIIPYYNGDPTKDFDRDNVSAIALQVKNRIRPETDFLGDFEKIEADLASVSEESEETKKGLEEYLCYRDFASLNLTKSPLVTILCEVGREPGAKSKNVDLKVLEGHNTVFGLRLIGSKEDTYGCLKGDRALQEAFATLIGYSYDPFIPHSKYEEDITAGNSIF